MILNLPNHLWRSSKMKFDIKNKSFLIFGANGLLGKKLTEELLSHGAKIYAADINFSKDKVFQHKNLKVLNININNLDQVEELFKGDIRFDGAVNCTYPRNNNYGKSFFDVAVEDFNENISMNLGGVFLFSRCCANYFIKRKTPFSLVNIASIYGVISPKFEIYDDTKMTMPIEYSAIKSSLIHLSKYITSYINNSDFRINCVSPGGIFDNQEKNFLEAYKRNTFGTGMLEAEDVCGTVLFLLSDASKFINGQNIVVDDGFSL